MSAEKVKACLSTIPDKPGIYKMISSKGITLYVGKAKNLKKRVSQYINIDALSAYKQKLIKNTTKVEFVITGNEAEALLLEAQLIKALQPNYNILLRDDKSYPYIILTLDHDYPRIAKFRSKYNKSLKKLFGPFVSAGAVKGTIVAIQKTFLIRPCSDSFFKSRTKPCLEYQIKRCSAPCVGKISVEDYQKLVAQAAQTLSGRSQEMQRNLARAMRQASDAMEYEKAAIYRDRIKALESIQCKNAIAYSRLPEADVVGLYIEDNEACAQVFMIRGGQNFGNHCYFFAAHDLSAEEAIAAFLGQFYSSNMPPKNIHLSHGFDGIDIFKEAIFAKIGSRINIRKANTPLVELACSNAKYAVEQRVTRGRVLLKKLEKLAQIFGLEKIPERIEVYDNSHIMGSNPFGAMIVAGKYGFKKQEYRLFRIKQTKKGDDYAMMQEVLGRRFIRLKNQLEIWPDFLLIDGGPGHMSVVQKVMREHAVEIPFACISKGPDRHSDRFYVPDRGLMILPSDDPVLYYLQTIRDEAHRFVISSHRHSRLIKK
ncbi:UvrABC system protein C [Rickettsiales bacterium]|nr:UvrABC system protein C [Rickettsiales bacterium]